MIDIRDIARSLRPLVMGYANMARRTDVIGMYRMLPQLRGLWGMSSVDENGLIYDYSSQGRTLSPTAAPTYGMANDIIPYTIYDGATQYHSRADEAGLDITGALTLGCWCWFDADSGTATVSKWTSAGDLRAYHIGREAANDRYYASISSNGASGGITTVYGTTGAAPVSTWHFVCGRYTPSTELAIFVNDVKAVNTTSIPASIFNSSAALMVGGVSAAASLPGRATLVFICADALSDALISGLYESSRYLFGV